MTGRQLLSKLEKLGCVKVRQKGSHAIVRCGKCRAIERQFAPCLGEGWLKGN